MARPVLARRGAAGEHERARFAAEVLAVVVVAVAVRLWFALAIAPDLPPPGDALLYRELGANLADGHGLALPPLEGTGLEPSAEHPPLFPVLLGALDVVGLDGAGQQRAVLALVSAGGVALVALLGRRVAGDAVGLLAASVAAVHPLWFQPPGLVMSETLHLVLVPAVVLVALGVLDRPSWRRVAALGVLVGVAGLVRSEALALGALVGLPAVVLAHPTWRDRLRGLGVLAAAAGVMVVPWVVRNQQQLGILSLSTNVGKTVYGSACDDTFSGPQLGGFSYDCQFGAAAVLVASEPPEGDRWDAVLLDRELGDHARAYLEDHAGEVPKVVAARVARMWGLAFAGEQLRFDVGEGRHRPSQRVGQWVHLGLLPLAAAGAVSLGRRSRRDVLIVLGPVALVTLTTLLIYGGTRMRTGAEPSVAVLASVAMAALGRRVAGHRFPGAGDADGRIPAT